MKLDARITRGLNREEVQEMIDRHKNASIVLDAIAKVLTDELEQCTLKEEGDDILDSPNALAKLTNLAARRKALRFALTLVRP